MSHSDLDLEMNLLETFFKENPKIMLNITNILDSTNGWRIIMQELKNFRIPVYLKYELAEQSQSPSTFLINELIIRSCTVNDFKDILTQSNQFDALALIDEPVPPKIITQPGNDYEKVYVAYGDDLKLECIATGVPPPTYQWYCDNVLLTDQNSSIMTVTNFREQTEGEYYCIVTQQTDNYILEVTSNIIVCTLLESLPEFIKNLPPIISLNVGEELKLEVEIFCRSNYKIEWIMKNHILEGEGDCKLTIKNVNKTNTGKYRCVVKNLAGEVFSEVCQVTVLNENRRTKASAKVALLIANSKYDNFTHLKTPIEDVLLLAEKLEKLCFHVITLIDLTLQEMHNYINWFFGNLPPRAYAFVCYIGHGFLLLNNKFMMPVDCPKQNEYRMADCILDELLVKKAVESKLKLLVIILDMCLKGPNKEENPDIFNERPPDYTYVPNSKCSKVQAFATSNHQGAYECPNMLHGFYIEHLCRYLESDKPITHVFETAHQEFLKNKVVELQKPCLSYDADQKFKLTDPAEETVKILLPFVKVKEELKYEHELYFSKVNLNTTLFSTPHRGRILNAIDMKFTQTVLNKWKPAAIASPESLAYAWTPSPRGNEYFLTLYNIQKVKTNIYITVHLTETDEFNNAIESDNTIDLGLPLIASANYWFQRNNQR